MTLISLPLDGTQSSCEKLISVQTRIWNVMSPKIECSIICESCVDAIVVHNWIKFESKVTLVSVCSNYTIIRRSMQDRASGCQTTLSLYFNIDLIPLIIL